MENTPAKLLDVVALVSDKSDENLLSGQVGTIVEVLTSDVFEVEFSTSDDRTSHFAELKHDEFLVLRHEPIPLINPDP